MQLDTAKGAVRGNDETFMQVALGAARRAAMRGEVPIGAVLVRGAQVIAVAHNASIGLNDPTAHAEVLALREGARAEGNYRLTDTTLYVTLEPCVMCVGAIRHARVWRVVFACPDPKAGALGSVYDLGSDERSNHRVQVDGGVCAAQAIEVLQSFFRVRRGA